MRSKLLVSLALCASVPFSGCAVLFHGSSQAVSVGCNVPGATVRVDGMAGGPGTRILSRGEAHTVSAEAPGYAPSSAAIERQGSKAKGKSFNVTLKVDPERIRILCEPKGGPTGGPCRRSTRATSEAS